MESIRIVDKRLTELEVKASFGEDLMDQLNQVVVRQQTQIDALIREVARLQQSHADGVRGNDRQLGDDLPPHY
ncbi:SlyX family protein [Rhodoferax sp. PAMC 29310]|jgi:SlyX protein|uniref:SlyX family protein n=1 Tax=Rhodoferax sp. PAMC 29310 TaxID=2822760 RepID=UPI001B33A12C|nr:SlyX family protein [Rhodoferax sp. PAMC 29310]